MSLLKSKLYLINSICYYSYLYYYTYIYVCVKERGSKRKTINYLFQFYTTKYKCIEKLIL